MIALVGCKQEQCVAETSRTQQSSGRGPKINPNAYPAWTARARNISIQSCKTLPEEGLIFYEQFYL